MSGTLQTLHVFVLFHLAVAARLYDVLGRQPMFFAVRRAGAGEVLLLVLAVSLLLPASIAVVEWLAGLAGRRARLALHAAVVALLAGVATLPLLKQLAGLPGGAVVAIGLALGVVAAAIYLRFAAARAVVTILAPVVLLFPGLFLCASPAAKFLARSIEPAMADVRVTRPAPVVMIVLDEFCGTSLMDAEHRIDRVRYPHFARLADDATWYRNATTMSPSTHEAVPSLLTGRRPLDPSHPPLASEYPQNLFTLLGGRYDLVAWEAETYLAPGGTSGYGAAETGPGRRLRSLAIDTTALALHVLLPPDGPCALPDITGRWGNFLGQDDGPQSPSPHTRRSEHFRDFLAAIRPPVPAERPRFYFLHSMLPHVPWTYTALGKEYAYPLPPETLDNTNVTHGVIGLQRKTERWVDDPWAVQQAYQRYLVQVAFVDRLIGRLVRHLKAAGMYDECLIVVTADHGVSFRPGDDRRAVSRTNLADILSIPLFIKAPRQRQGVVSDRNMQSADVLPTMADLLGIELPWPVDGVSAVYAWHVPAADKGFAEETSWDQRRVVDARFEEKYESLDRMLRLFGSGTTDGLFRVGPHPELLGRPVAEIGVGEELKFPGIWSGSQQVYVGGRIPRGPMAPLPEHVAVAVNGIIRATTRTFVIEGLEDCWAALLPESAFTAEENEVQSYVIRTRDGRPVLHPLPKGPSSH